MATRKPSFILPDGLTVSPIEATDDIILAAVTGLIDPATDDSAAHKKFVLDSIAAAVGAIPAYTGGNGLTLTGNDFSINTGDGLDIVSDVLKVVVDGVSIGFDGNGALQVIAAPAATLTDNPYINGQQTYNFTAQTINDLTRGNSADALHTHGMVQAELTAGGTVAVGDPVVWGANGVVKGDSATSANHIIGITLDAGNNGDTLRVVRLGNAQGVISGATAGTVYYLKAGGGTTTTAPTTGQVVRVGIAASGNTLDVAIHRGAKLN